MGATSRSSDASFLCGRQVEAVDRTFKDIITVATIKDLEGDLVRSSPLPLDFSPE